MALTDPNDVRRLNGVIDTGLAAVGGLGATAALVCMADLPHLTTEDLDAVFAESHHDAVLVPDGPGMGTNALYLCPPQRSPTCFGHEESRMLHQARFRAMGMKVAVVRPPGMLRDVDVPRDLPADVVAHAAR